MKLLQSRILPDTPAGSWQTGEDGQKAWLISGWIRLVLRKLDRYRAKHQVVLNEAATTLQLALPRDIVMNGVLPFLDLPLHSFE